MVGLFNLYFFRHLYDYIFGVEDDIDGALLTSHALQFFLCPKSSTSAEIPTRIYITREIPAGSTDPTPQLKSPISSQLIPPMMTRIHVILCKPFIRYDYVIPVIRPTLVVYQFFVHFVIVCKTYFSISTKSAPIPVFFSAEYGTIVCAPTCDWIEASCERSSLFFNRSILFTATMIVFPCCSSVSRISRSSLVGPTFPSMISTTFF